MFGPDQFLITSVVRSINDVVVGWRAFGGNRYRVQAAGDPLAGYTDISPEVTATGAGIVLTNYVDSGGLTNSPSRVYRIRQVW